MIINVHSVYRNLLVVNLCISCMLLVRGLAPSLMEIDLKCVILQIEVLCRVKMNNALGHIKSYISLIRCFVCCFKFPCPSCGEIFVFVSDLYLYRHCVVFCCCIKFNHPSRGEVWLEAGQRHYLSDWVPPLTQSIIVLFLIWTKCT